MTNKTAIVFGIIFVVLILSCAKGLEEIAKAITASKQQLTLHDIESQLTTQFKQQFGDKVQAVTIAYFAGDQVGIDIQKTPQLFTQTAMKFHPAGTRYWVGTFTNVQAKDANLPEKNVNVLLCFP